MWDLLKRLFNFNGWLLLFAFIFGIDASDMDNSSDLPDKATTDNTRESNIPLDDSKINKN